MEPGTRLGIWARRALVGPGAWVIAGAVSAIAAALLVYPALSGTDQLPARTLYAHTAYIQGRQLLFAATILVPMLNSALVAVWMSWGLSSAISALARRLWPGVEEGREALPRRGRLALLARIALVLVSLVPLSLWAATNADQPSRSSQAEFRRICSQCHSHRGPLSHFRSEQAWEITIDRMKSKSPGMISDEDARTALEYINAVRSWSEEELFTAKCLSCHEDSKIRGGRGAEEWSRIVGRVVGFNPIFISPMQQQSLTTYLSERWPAAAPPTDKTQVLFEEACVQCHTLDVILLDELAGADWPDLLIRMQDKAPWLLDEDQARSLAPWIRQMRARPEQYRSSVPHQSRELFFAKAPAEQGPGP